MSSSGRPKRKRSSGIETKSGKGQGTKKEVTDDLCKKEFMFASPCSSLGLDNYALADLDAFLHLAGPLRFDSMGLTFKEFLHGISGTQRRNTNLFIINVCPTTRSHFVVLFIIPGSFGGAATIRIYDPLSTRLTGALVNQLRRAIKAKKVIPNCRKRKLNLWLLIGKGTAGVAAFTVFG